MMSNQRQKKGRVIPFERSGEFFLRRGSQRLERNNLLDAINNYHLAREREPQNVEVQLAIAEVLTEMHRYEQSNQLLFPLLSTPEKPSECFYGIACNFLGLQNFEQAKDSLESYLTVDPDGEFVPDALELLDVLEDDEILYTMPGVMPEEERDTLQACSLGRQLIEQGRVAEAVTLLEENMQAHPDAMNLRNHLALAYFCDKNYKRATEEVRAVLDIEPDNIQAHSNMLLFCFAARDEEGAQRSLEYLKNVQTQNVQDWNRMAVVFMETGHMDDARRYLKKLLQVLPYDESTLHRLGACYYESGQYTQALACYDKLIKINPEDTIAAYYRTICHRAMRGTPENVEWRYHYQVPFKEYVRRVNLIHEISVAPPEASKKRWEEDAKFRAQLTWCLCLPDENAKRALLTLMESFGGYEAERALRKFLLEPLQPDAVKQDVFTMLKRMGAREPYIAYLGGRLVQSRVRVRYAKESDGVPAAYMRVYRQITENMPTRCAVETILCAMELFEQYTTNTEPLPPLRPMQEAAVAAAFEYIARRVMKEPITQTEVAEAYGVSTIRLRNAVGRIRAGLKEE